MPNRFDDADATLAAFARGLRLLARSIADVDRQFCGVVFAEALGTLDAETAGQKISDRDREFVLKCFLDAGRSALQGDEPRER